MSTTIRVSEQTRDRFAKLAAETGRPMTDLVEEAADALERRVFFEQLATGYEALRADASVWHEVEAERSGDAAALQDRSA